MSKVIKFTHRWCPICNGDWFRCGCRFIKDWSAPKHKLNQKAKADERDIS